MRKSLFRGAFVVSAVLALSSCSAVPIFLPSLPRGSEDAQPSSDGSPSPATSCTGRGRLQTYDSTQRTDWDTQNSSGENFTFARVMSQPADEGAIAILNFSGPTAVPADITLGIGEKSTYDEWTITVTSICEDAIGFEAEMTP